MPGRSGYLSGFAAGLFCFLSIFCHSAVLYAERLQQIDQQPSYSPVAPQFQDLKTLPKIKVKTFEFTGNTIFSSEQLGKISAPYENREITFEELESLRQAITLHYVNNGYINSGAIIPDQQVVDGTVRIQVIEGNITSINVEGNKYFRTSYFTKRIERATGPPLNMGKLQDMLQLLNQDSRIKRLNAELKPGVKPGEGELNVKVEENLPYKASINFNNNVNPSIGDVKGELWLSHQNLFGLGDVLEGSYGKTQGLDEYRISYSLPITAYDTYLNVHYTNNQSTVIQDVFRSLDIKSLTNTFGITLSQPIIRTPEHEFWLSLTGDYRDSTQTLLGEGFSFSEGQDDGKSKVRVLRFAQEYVSRSQNQIIAARSSFSLGLSILGATRGDSPGPDGRFLAWLGQVKYLRKITEGGTQFVFRTDMQFTRDPPPADRKVLDRRHQLRAGVPGEPARQGQRHRKLIRTAHPHLHLVIREQHHLPRPFHRFWLVMELEEGHPRSRQHRQRRHGRHVEHSEPDEPPVLLRVSFPEHRQGEQFTSGTGL